MNMIELVTNLLPFFPGWEASGHRTVAYLENGQAKMMLHAKDRRVTISGFYPDGWHPQAAPRITVDPQRVPEVIAADIKRRFLPRYLEQLAVATQQQADYEAALTRRQEQLQQLAEILDTPVRNNGGDPWIDWRAGDGWGVIRVAAADSVTLDLRWLPFDAALAVCQVLRAYTATCGLPG